MFGLFGKKDTDRLSGPKDIPELVGRHMVVEGKQNPDRVWALKGVVRPAGKNEFYCRVFDPGKVAQTGVQVKDWTSLDGHPELVLWEGYVDKGTNVARPEKYPEPSRSS